MKILTALGLSLVGLMVAGGAVQAKPQPAPSCSAVAYMVLPDGRCLNLTYTSVLGQSRGFASAQEAQYKKLLNANLYLDTDFEYRVTESNKDKDRRDEVLKAYKGMRDKAAADNQSIEDAAWPIHVRAMTTVENAFKHP